MTLVVEVTQLESEPIPNPRLIPGLPGHSKTAQTSEAADTQVKLALQRVERGFALKRATEGACGLQPALEFLGPERCRVPRREAAHPE
jgi:hypothetical protein